MRLSFLCALSLLLTGCPGVTDTDATEGPHVELLSSEPCSACGGDCVRESFRVNFRRHLTGFDDYEFSPPPGGPHDPCWADWGTHAEELPPYNWVHNMEHGGIVAVYDCPAGCADEIAALNGYVTSVTPGTAILTPGSVTDAAFSPAFGIMSWGERLLLGCVDLAEVDAFYQANVDNAPESTSSGPPDGCHEN